MSKSRTGLMKFFVAQYIEWMEEIANASEAPEALPEHRAAVLALLRARGLTDEAAGRDERTDAENDNITYTAPLVRCLDAYGETIYLSLEMAQQAAQAGAVVIQQGENDG